MNELLVFIELVSKELNHLAAILHVYAGGLIYEVKKIYYYFSKRKWKYFYTFNHFYSEKSSKIAQMYYYDPQSAGKNVQSPQSESTPRRLTLKLTD